MPPSIPNYYLICNEMTYFQGLRLARILSEESERLTLQKYPDLKILSWSSINHLAQRESLLNNPAITVPFTWVGSQSNFYSKVNFSLLFLISEL